MNFSIIIPTSNRPKPLIRLIKSLAKLNYNDAIEVIVITNSNNYTESASSALDLYKNRLQLRQININQNNISKARNTGIKLAKYSKLIFLDDDVEVKKNFLFGYKAGWEKYPNYSLLAGGIKTKVNSKNSSSFLSQTLLTKFGWCFANQPTPNYDQELKMGSLFFSANISMSKNSNLNFNENLGKKNDHYLLGAEDYELCYSVALSDRKGILLSITDCEVVHYVNPERFSKEYLSKRHLLNGLELIMMEKELKTKFDNFEDTHLRKLLSSPPEFLGVITNPYKLLTLFSYLVNKFSFWSN